MNCVDAIEQEFTGGITNGNDWYTIYGGMQDWNYIKADCWELTLELAESKNPSPADLAKMWEDNYMALLNLALEGSLGGIYGTVKSEITQEPLVASISVDGIDKVIMSKGSFGDFYRPLAPGQYLVRVSAPGYRIFSQTVTVPSGIGEGYVLRVFLSKDSTNTRVNNIKRPEDNFGAEKEHPQCTSNCELADSLRAQTEG